MVEDVPCDGLQADSTGLSALLVPEVIRPHLSMGLSLGRLPHTEKSSPCSEVRLRCVARAGSGRRALGNKEDIVKGDTVDLLRRMTGREEVTTVEIRSTSRN